MSDELGAREAPNGEEVPENESDVDEQFVDLIPDSDMDEDDGSLPSPP